MRNFRANRKNETGFSLIELVITISILSLVSLILYSVNAFGLRSFTNSQKSAEKQFETRMATDFIINKIIYADSIEILTDAPTSTPANAHDIYFDSGQLKYYQNGAESNIPGISGVNDFTFSIAKKAGTSNMVNLKIGKGDPSFDLSTDAIILNLDANGIIGPQSGIGIRFYTDKADSVSPTSIESINPPNDIYVLQNAPALLPKRLTANMENGTTREVSVRWSPSDVDTTEIGVFSCTGSVVGYNVPMLQVVRVVSLPILEVPTLTIQLYVGQEFGMPETVSAVFSDGETTIINDVVVQSWDTELDTSEIGNFLAYGYINDEFTVELQLTVLANSIVSLDPLSITINQGVAFELPPSINANFTDGSKYPVTVSWSPSMLDTMTYGIKTSTATATSDSSKSTTLTLTVNQSNLPTPIGTIITSGNNGTIKVKGLTGTAVLRKNNGTTINSGVLDSNGEYTFTNINTSTLYDVILIKSGWFDSAPYVFN